ncbi:MAG TPA: DUF3341 domain-containing protein [Longimicrobiaceae bacterium]|nr:DUF3341 domain-containing protein [Longimicrobiaceae bacterium]
MRTGLYAEFESPDAMLAALRALRERGIERLEGFAPYDVPGLIEAVGVRRSRIPAATFVGGLFGAVAAFLIQTYANAWHYPLNAGGRPTFAVPSFIFSTFEGMVICASFAAVIAFLISLRLPELWHPAFEVEGFDRVSTDRFFVGVDDRDPLYDPAAQTRLLEELGATHVYRVGGR